MKIVIYDTQHYEMVNVLFNVFDSPENRILFLVDEKIKRKLESHPITSNEVKKHEFIIENDFSDGSFFDHSSLKVQEFNPDLMVFNTIDKDYASIWKFIKGLPFPFFVTIHNINTWLNPPFTLNRLALTNYYYRRKILKKSTFLAVQEELFIQYIENKKLYKKPVLVIPHTLREENPIQPKNEKIRVAIPGGIDGVRRDNDFALDVIEEINRLNDRFQFVFLGKVVGHLGEKIWERVVRLQKKGLDIQHYYDDHSNLVFDTQMKQCDLVFLPLNVETKYEGIPEIYGTTKVTGVIYDMMRFSKPGIVPSKMVIPPTMKESLVGYNSKEQLIDILMEWSNNPDKVEKMKSFAGQNAEYYDKSAIRHRVMEDILNVMKKSR